MAGCYKDLGNYTYKDINDVFISGIEDNYTLLYKDTLRITPKLAFSGAAATPDADLEFEWVTVLSEPGNDSSRKVISTARNLAFEAAVRTGSYTAYCRIRNKQSGVQYQKKFSFSVQTTTYEGWVVLCDVNGNTRIDMVSKLADKDLFIKDLSTYSGAPMPPLKGPRALSLASDYVSQPTTTTMLYVMTDDGTHKMHGNTWQWNPKQDQLREMLAPVPATYRPYRQFTYGSCFIILSSDKDVYAMYPQNGIGYGTSVSKMVNTGAAVDLAPFIGSPNTTIPNIAMVFDKTRRWFLRLDAGSDRGCDTIPTPDNALFSYKIGMDLLYMAFTRFNSGDNIAVLKDPATGKHHFMRMALDGFTPTFRQYQFQEISEATGDIVHAEHFAFGQELGYLLYSVGGKLYQYDINYNTHKLMADLGAEKITMLKTRPFGGTSEPYQSYGKSVIVGSQLPGGTADENGKLRIYVMPERNEPFTLFREWSGFGKILDIVYRAR